MLQPQPPTPPTPPSPEMLTPPDAAPPPPPVVPAQTVAKTVPESTPLTKMMEEADKALAKVDKNRLSIEVKKAEAAEDVPDTPPKPEMTPPKPEMALTTPPETQPQKPIPKALPVADDEPVTRTTRNQDPNAFTPFTRTTQTKGMISNRGSQSSVDAEETPKGRYIRQVLGKQLLAAGTEEESAEGRRAGPRGPGRCGDGRLLRRDGVTYGSLEIIFYVNKKGKVENLRVINDKESNPVLTNFTLQAIRDAEIPTMPADVIPSLPMNDQGRLKIEYNVLIY